MQCPVTHMTRQQINKLSQKVLVFVMEAPPTILELLKYEKILNLNEINVFRNGNRRP